MDRKFSSSLPYLPRYHSVSPARAPRRFSSVRSLSQPSQRLLYVEGERMKLSNSYFEPPRPTKIFSYTPPSKGKRIIIIGSKFNSPIHRTTKSNSWNDVNSSHLYSSIDSLYSSNKTAERAGVASAVSCDDIYHKGPYFPDASQSESGVSLGESDDGGEDDSASQFSYGSSSAFFETTLDLESDRCESEYSGDRTLDSADMDFSDGKTSPAAVGRGRGHARQHGDHLGLASPLSYAEARKRELIVKSPSWEFEKAQSKFHSLKVSVPTGEMNSPVAQSTPHVSPRSFYGPKLSVKASWNVDDPPEHIFTDSVEKPSAVKSLFPFSLFDIESTKQDKMEASSCYSSFSEDNMSDIHSPQSTPKKTKTLRKASERPLHKSSISKLALAKTTSDNLKEGNHREISEVSVTKGAELTPEMLGVCIPPLESVIGPDEKSGPEGREGQWWAVYNIETATARQEAGEGSEIQDSNSDTNREVKIVKPMKTGIPLISPGRYGQERLKQSSSSPPPDEPDSARRKSPPLLSLSPSLVDRINKDEIGSEIRDNWTRVCASDVVGDQGKQPIEFSQVGCDDGINIDGLPLQGDPVPISVEGEDFSSPLPHATTKDDRLDAHATGRLGNMSELSHGHQNTTLTTADGTDEPNTNSCHYPLGNLSITGHYEGKTKIEEEEERKENNTGTHHQLSTAPGGSKQVAVREVDEEASEISSGGSLPVSSPSSVQEGRREKPEDTCGNTDCSSNRNSNRDETSVSVSVFSLESGKSSVVAFDSLCQRFEALSLSGADLDATLVAEKTDGLSMPRNSVGSSELNNWNVNTSNVDTESPDGVGQENLVRTIDVSILSGNIGLDKIVNQAANMDYSSSQGTFASLCCLGCRGSLGVASNEKSCDCLTHLSIHPSLAASSEKAPTRNDEEKRKANHSDDTKLVRVVATAQLPTTTADGDRQSITEVDESGDKILLGHSANLSHYSDDSQLNGEYSLQLLPRRDEQDAHDLSEISSANISQSEQRVNVNRGDDDDGKNSDGLWQQEGFFSDYCHGQQQRPALRDGDDRSINSPTRAGQREDAGIPRTVVDCNETDAQKDGESAVKAAEGVRHKAVRVDASGDECLLQQPSSPSSYQPAGPGSLNETTLTTTTTKVVKQIHRKTVEETVTIERSVVTNPTYSHYRGDISEELIGSSGAEGSSVVDYISSTNRKETVIEETVDVDYITPTPCTAISAPNEDLCDFEINNSGQQIPVSRDKDNDVLSNTAQDLKSYTLCSGALDSNSSSQPTQQLSAHNFSTACTPVCTAEGQITQCTTEPIDGKFNDSPQTLFNMRDFTTANKLLLEGDPAFITKLNNMPQKTTLGNGVSSRVHPSTSKVGHHQNALDNLQAQLSYITGCSNDGQDGRPSSAGVFSHGMTSTGHDTKYRDHGEATSVSKQNLHNGSASVSGVAEHDIKHTHQQHTPAIGVSINGQSRHLSLDKAGVTGGAVVKQQSSKTTGNLERYDNDDYDNISDPEPTSSKPHMLSVPNHHHFSRPSHLKSSSLWTLPEETESVLEGLSPKPSPHRHFAFFSAEGDKNSVNNFGSDGKTDNVNSLSNECDEPMDENDNVFYSSPVNFIEEQRKRFYDSSELEESDGNYSSRSTTDSFGGHRSSSIEREVTPLSDVDMSSGGLTAGKLNSQMTDSPSPSVRPDNINSFYDFVTGLETGEAAVDMGNQSQTSVDERGGNQITSPATAPRQQVHSVTVPSGPQSSIGFSLDSNNTDGDYSYPSSHFSPLDSSMSSMGSPDGKQTGFQSPLITHSSTSLASEDMLNSSFASSSFQSSNMDLHSEGSFRLHALDLDLSRISSCGSPAPSDFSESSSYVCTGTAEIKKNLSVSFDDDYDVIPSPTPGNISASTPMQPKLKSALKKPTAVHNKSNESTKHIEWVKQFDQIIEDFNNKTSHCGPDSDVTVIGGEGEDTTPGRGGSPTPSQDMYTLFTNDQSEKKQNHACIVNEPQEMNTYRFKRFLKKSHTKRSSRGKRIVRFLSKLSCVSESVQQSPDHSVCKKKAKLDSGRSYATDSTPLRDLPGTTSTAPQPVRCKSPLTYTCDTNNSPTSSNHSLDSFHSRTDSAYSSVSESVVLGSPCSSRSSSYQSSSSTLSPNKSRQDSAFSSISDSTPTNSVSEADSSNPFSPTLPNKVCGGDQSGEDMLSALSDVFHQLDMCEEQIDQALLNRLRHGHQPATLKRKN